ncbi:hypothetical protein Lser_V15G29254 [Lactuca serriola]
MEMDDAGVVVIKATVKGREIVITEGFIRDTLLIDDQPNFPTEIGIEDAHRILRRMGYEGTSPPTLKKFFPPYWRFLADVFLSCISGRRSGADEISMRNTGAIISLAAGVNFNFSRFILDEITIKIRASTRDTFLLYPRFDQLFINTRFPDMVKEGDTLHMKSLGPHTVGLIKQNWRGKVIFQGKYPLEKFGKFAELNESSESYESSDKASSEPASSEKSSANDDVITVSNDENREEEETPTPEANVAEEHYLIPANVQSDYVERTVTTKTEVEGYKHDSLDDICHSPKPRTAEYVLG